MKARVDLCHKRSDNYVCCMTDIGLFRYPKRLKDDVASKLINKVITAGYIDTKNWIGE
jgi:hypothetical protein